MLIKLEIQNFALIDHLDITWNKGLTVITGETGSGKSIMLGALGLILGQRADLQSIKDAGKKCVVEGHFQLNEDEFTASFTEIGHEFASYTILRREILPGGKSRAFINDVPATLDQLRAIAAQLIDIHSQHDTHLLTQPAFQLHLIDLYAGHHDLMNGFQEAYQRYIQFQSEWDQWQRNKNNEQDEDYLRFLVEELEEVNPKAGELELLEEEWNALNNVGDIKIAAGGLSDSLEQEEVGVLVQLRKSLNVLDGVRQVSKNINEIWERTQSAYIELKDIASEAYRTAENVQDDPERFRELEQRINTLNQLTQKHHCSHADELPEVLSKLQSQLNDIVQSADREAALKKQLAEQKQKVDEQAMALSTSRRKIIPDLEKKINQTLVMLNFSDASFHISLENKPLRSDGTDKPELLFTANKGMSPRPLQKVASGGELSRIMLAVKSSLASTRGLPTLIFDEIDTGIGGETAARVALLLRQMSADVQLVAITHLPQIAGSGQAHFKVQKEVQGEETVTTITSLDAGQRIEEIARMLSGNTITSAAKENARDLLFQT
jgi:DNA repair protein RecN (Recombination protein N)